MKKNDNRNIAAAMVAAFVIGLALRGGKVIESFEIIEVEKGGDNSETIVLLKKELAKAIESENYERAAKVRDLIKQVENAI